MTLAPRRTCAAPVWTRRCWNRRRRGGFPSLSALLGSHWTWSPAPPVTTSTLQVPQQTFERFGGAEGRVRPRQVLGAAFRPMYVE